MNGNRGNRLLGATLVIGLGVFFLLRQMGYIDIGLGSLVYRFWPLALIIYGIVNCLPSGGKQRNMSWGVVLIILGVFFLGNSLNVISISLGALIARFWPVAIIIAGVVYLFQSRTEKKTTPPPRDTKQGEEWQSYGAYTGQETPPPPPLHRDPTRPFFEGDVEQPKSEQGMGGNYGRGVPPQEEQMHGQGNGYDQHWQKQDHSHQGQNGYYGRGAGSYNDTVETRSGFIGDVHLGKDYWELRPMVISHFIGDTKLDLTKAQVPYGETELTISSFIGDVKIFVPNDHSIGVEIVSNVFIGDVKAFGRKEGGFMSGNLRVQSSGYAEHDRRVRLVVNSFIGDVKATKVG